MSGDQNVTIIDVGPGHIGLVDIVQKTTFDVQVGKAVLQDIQSALPVHQASHVCFIEVFSDIMTFIEEGQACDFLEVNSIAQCGSVDS